MGIIYIPRGGQVTNANQFIPIIGKVSGKSKNINNYE